MNKKPQFGKIEKIIEYNGRIFFYINYLITKSYENHLCAYHVTTTNAKTFLSIQNLPHFMPYDIYKLKNHLYIATI